MLAFDPDTWYETLEGRYLEDLAFSEVRRALQALSTVYVERRDRIGGGALDGRGKRSAFGLFFGPLHFFVVRHVVRELGASTPPPKRIVDLGCGTGAAGAAWALETGGVSAIAGIDSSGWAVEEASWTYRSLGLTGSARCGNALEARIGGAGQGVLAAFTINELDDTARATMRDRLLRAHGAGSRILIVEPIARRAFPWWPAWSEPLLAAGGREDEWRFAAAFPERMRLLDRAAGLHHRELTARSIWLG